jgi:phage/plasmid-associated DNA primase
VAEDDRRPLPVSGLLSELAPGHPLRWLLVPGKDGAGIDLNLTQLRMPTDDMLAALVISEMAEGQFRHVVSSGTWHYWNGHYHPADTDNFMRRVVQAFAHAYGQALRMIEKRAQSAAAAEAVKAHADAEAKGLPAAAAAAQIDKRFDQVMTKALGFLKPQFAYGRQLLNDPVQERVYKQLAKMLGTDGSEYDRDKTLVSFADGTFELKAPPERPGWPAGRFRGHRQADKLTSCLAYEFVPAAWEDATGACPRYVAMMRRLSGDNKELLLYNLGVEALGLISGNPGELLHFRCGGSNMGKSVCCTVTGLLAGSRWYSAAADLICVTEDKGRFRHASVLATLEGKTYVTVDETDGSMVLDASTLKMLTSTRFMPATELYRPRQQQMPRDWTIVGNANTGKMPRIYRSDSGLERRVRIIPVPESDPAGTPLQDGYADLIVDGEGAAVCSLLVMTAARVLAYGRPEPAAVTGATEAYFESCDVRRAWLRQHIGPAPGSVVSSSQAYEAFRAELGSLENQAGFSLFIQARGYEIRKDGRGNMMIQNAKWI